MSKVLKLKQNEKQKENADEALKINQANDKLLLRYCSNEEVLKQ
jgi:hypothetical protein